MDDSDYDILTTFAKALRLCRSIADPVWLKGHIGELRLQRAHIFSVHRLRLREFPLAVEDFLARAIEPHGVVPPLHDRQAVRNLAVAAAELDGDRCPGLSSP